MGAFISGNGGFIPPQPPSGGGGGGGGGATIDLENNGVPLAGGPFSTLNLAPALVAVDEGGGTAGIDIAPITDMTVLGNDSGGALAPTAVTADQILDWVSATNGVLLTRIAGAWAAAAKAGIDSDGDLLLTENAAPTTPASAKVKVYAANIAGRSMPAYMSSLGIVNPVQPLIGAKSIAMWTPIANGNTMHTQGINATATGTPTARAPASTNAFTAARRIGYISGAGAGASGGVRFVTPYLWRGNALGLGGFHAAFRFGWSDATLVATGRGIVGLWAGSGGVPGDVDPDTLVNVFGVGNNNGDTNLQVYAAGAVAQPRVDLGASFPAQTVSTDWYEVHLFAAPNGATLGYKVYRLNTGAIAEGTISAAASLPSDTAFLGPIAWRSNGGTAAAVAVDVGGLLGDGQLIRHTG